MNEPQVTQEEKGTKSNTKWILLIAGGGCALLACIALVIALAVALLFPVTGQVFNKVTEELESPQPAIDDAPQPLDETPIPESKYYPLAVENMLGDPDAPVTIIVYSDFQCIYCMNYWEDTEPQIIENYVKTGQVYYIYHSFGDFLGPESATAAEAAYCAGDQDMFWDYHDLLFQNWAGEGTGDYSPDRLRGYAEELGLDANQFTDCLESGAHASTVDQDVTEGQANGIRATPSFLINGELVEGALPYSTFESKIKAALGNE
jgi:protein-disulfide isomerase